MLGAVAQATSRVELMTYVTCPTMRYHPAVVAQKAATVQLLSDGRFTLGLGAGENLNEHVRGGAWPPVDVRHEMLEEGIQIIRKLFAGETVTFRGAPPRDRERRAVGPSAPSRRRSASPCPGRRAARSPAATPTR